MSNNNTNEQQRLDRQWSQQENWYKFGPYLSERQWGTVREDYTAEGDAWTAFPHEHARMRTYRWGEDGLGGISDDTQTLCFALALWNGQDDFLKERLFGLSNEEGNHGEDVKELYYYLDNTPTHSYMRMLYKYPQTAFPYKKLVSQNKRRKITEREYELLDTNLFAKNKYFDVVIDYAKNDPDDILIRLTITNRSDKAAPLHVLPTLWFRNRWSFSEEATQPHIERVDSGQDGRHQVKAIHERLGGYTLSFQAADAVLMTENTTNKERVFGHPNESPFVKDAFHDAVTTGQLAPFDQQPTGTKCAPVYALTLAAGQTIDIKLRLHQAELADPLGPDFDEVYNVRQQEADAFYAPLTTQDSADDALVKRQAWAGLLWSKQYYHYNVRRWLEGDPGDPIPPSERWRGRNADWQHLDAEHIMVMPDKWEYPWFAAWDQAFQAIALASIDLEFAKHQLYLHADTRYQAPDGRLPAYEWDFSANNPPLRAAISWLFYSQELIMTGKKDYEFLSTMFKRLRPNYEWWNSQLGGKQEGMFQGGFLGLDNISLFDRSDDIPAGGSLDQADATAWMATYTLYMMRICVELAQQDPLTYEPLSCYYFDYYIRINNALQTVAKLWIDDEDPDSNNGFAYDVLHLPSGKAIPIMLRSMVGLSPLFAVMSLKREIAQSLPTFYQKIQDYQANPLSKNPCYCVLEENDNKDSILFSLLSADQLARMATFIFSEDELLAPGGIRSLSKVYEKAYSLKIKGTKHQIHYTPGESDSSMYGGNSNWRGPVWWPMNYFIVKALEEFGNYHGTAVQVALPFGSDNHGTLNDAAAFLSERLWQIFRPDAQGRRPLNGEEFIYADDPNFRNLVLFYEHFDGDTSRGLGASHQTGWTALVTCL
ncbi:MGH1-like glycoside hydrolase domain-containing protein [Spirosoma agri]|uniref:MGH1-like glycoside hydrolase domain-containing protein n=1 Tax=Spirosoma agri TaxID=1987381 RepID=UPI001FEABA24|nr:glucosidase [Spirosoma agri]